jgi:hypothetical protein
MSWANTEAGWAVKIDARRSDGVVEYWSVDVGLPSPLLAHPAYHTLGHGSARQQARHIKGAWRQSPCAPFQVIREPRPTSEALTFSPLALPLR